MEIELKLQVPAPAQRAVAAMVRAHASRSQTLQALYFDTADGLLAQHGMALRLRKEGRVWFQTLKRADSAAASARHEHNVRLGVWPAKAATPTPLLDPSLHAESEAGVVLAKLLRKSGAPDLLPQYQTKIQRLSAAIRTRRGLLEYALDVGALSGGASGTGRDVGDGGESGGGRDSEMIETTDVHITSVEAEPLLLPVRELELELLSGSPLALTEVALRLVKQHGLWLDVRSKSQRGACVARGWLQVPASRAERVRLKKARTFSGLVHAVLGECSRHLLLNVSQIASEQGSDSDHVHQARVALRRLRTALGLFGSVDAAAHSTVLPDWSEPAAALGTALSSNRDRDVMMASLWPRLRAAGAPLVELPAASAVQPPEWVVRQTQVQTWLLELIRFELQPRSVAVVKVDVDDDGELESAAAAEAAASAEADWSVVLPVLRKWHKQCVRGAREFAGLRLEKRHDLRKKMKRLRYGLEFIENECSKKQWKQFMPQLALSLEALGEFNDYHVALEQYQALALTDARAWFVVGFIQGQLLKTEKRVLKALAKFIEARPPWPKVAGSKLGRLKLAELKLAELKAAQLGAVDLAADPLALAELATAQVPLAPVTKA